MAVETELAKGPVSAEQARPRVIGRYTLYDVIASGGMASVHLGRLHGDAGFARTVAIKRLHAQFAHDPDFVAMFVDEARLAARIHHLNVIPTLDVVAMAGELFLVMDYVSGEALSALIRNAPRGEKSIPPRIACRVMSDVLTGLHAAHEARGEQGQRLELIHRDVSPQNILVGLDGSARIFDFGVAKATARLQQTAQGTVKGKLGYMAPEQLRGGSLSQRVDVYSASVVLWEALAGRRLVRGDREGVMLEQVRSGAIHPPSRYAPQLAQALDDVVLRGLSHDPERRFATAEQMASALERASEHATTSEVASWVRDWAGPGINSRAQRVLEIESASRTLPISQQTEAPTRILRRGADAPSRRSSRWLVLSAAVAALIAVADYGWRRAYPDAKPDPVPALAAEPPGAAPAPTVSAGPPPAVPDSPAASAEAPERRPVRAPARAGCNPPYTRDAKGRIHWTMGCL